jgi:cytochrome b561
MTNRYSAVAIALHWTIAALILFNLWMGLRLDAITGAARSGAFQLHKSIGITVLVLSVARLGWRLTHVAPPYPDGMKRWEKLLAGITHWGFYALMFAMPLTGWVMTSASPVGHPTLLYRAIPLPNLAFVHDLPMASRKGIASGADFSHILLSRLTIGLVLLHIAGALKHGVVGRDGVLYHMLPFRIFRARNRPG